MAGTNMYTLADFREKLIIGFKRWPQYMPKNIVVTNTDVIADEVVIFSNENILKHIQGQYMGLEYVDELAYVISELYLVKLVGMDKWLEIIQEPQELSILPIEEHSV